MTLIATMGTLCRCTMGATPSALVTLPTPRTLVDNKPIATINDHIPFVNILPFGVCSSPLCPTTAALTAAAFGVLTPGPCIPTVPAPWIPLDPTVTIGATPALCIGAQAFCAFGGMISLQAPAQVTVTAT